MECGVYNLKDIVKKLQQIDDNMELEKREKKGCTDLGTSIRKRFTYILQKKLGLGQEEIGWFKEKTNNGREQFVFQADKHVLLHLYNILSVLGRRNVTITADEEHSLIEDFAKILPYPISEGDVRACDNIFNERAYRIEQAIRGYYHESMVEDSYLQRFFVAIDTEQNPDKEKRWEFYRKEYEMVRSWQEKWLFILKTAKKMRRAERIDCLYKYEQTQTSELVGEERANFYMTGDTRCEDLHTAYQGVKKISSKDLCQYALQLFIVDCPEGEATAKGILESVKNEEGCFEECNDLFKKFIGYNLNNDVAEDFEYIRKEAIRELHTIYEILIQNGKINKIRGENLYPEVEILTKKGKLFTEELDIKKCNEKNKERNPEEYEENVDIEGDLKNLSNIRKHLNREENEKILVLNYI